MKMVTLALVSGLAVSAEQHSFGHRLFTLNVLVWYILCCCASLQCVHVLLTIIWHMWWSLISSGKRYGLLSWMIYRWSSAYRITHSVRVYFIYLFIYCHNNIIFLFYWALYLHLYLALHGFPFMVLCLKPSNTEETASLKSIRSYSAGTVNTQQLCMKDVNKHWRPGGQCMVSMHLERRGQKICVLCLKVQLSLKITEYFFIKWLTIPH